MICPDFDQVFYPILNAVRISPDFDQLSGEIQNCDEIHSKRKDYQLPREETPSD